MKTVLSDLIARLTEAKEGSRELDEAIWRAVGLSEADERRCRVWLSMDRRTDLTRDRFIAAWAPSFSTSLDAALTLVPEGLGWSFSTHERSANGAHLAAYVDGAFGFGATPALCLCIASLRARENKE